MSLWMTLKPSPESRECVFKAVCALKSALDEFDEGVHFLVRLHPEGRLALRRDDARCQERQQERH